MLHPAFGPICLVVAIVFGIYLAYELWRWFAGNPSELTPGQLARRMAGGLLLEATLLMWVLANPVMSARPVRERLVYLLFSMLLAVLAMLFAVREAGFVIRQYHRSRRELIQSLANERKRKDSLNGQ